MKLFISDIKKIDWLWNMLPVDFQTLNPFEYFVFYYDNVEATSSIDIKYTHKLNNFGTEKTLRIQYQRQSQQYGFFTDPMETDNSVLYMFLKYYVEKGSSEQNIQSNLKRLDELFLGFKAKDLEEARNESLTNRTGIFDTNSSSEMESAIKKFVFQPKNRNGILKVFEIVNSYFSSQYNHQLYGKKLKKVVTLIGNPSGGIITEERGTVRYMLVGENSFKANQDGKLDKAKEMMRSRISPLIIRQDTGWTLNPFDGKWRKRISDKDMHLILDKYESYNDRRFGELQLYAPFNQGIPREDVWKAIQDSLKSGANVSDLLKDGYTGTIADVVHHPILFEYYPELKELPYFSALYISRNSLPKNYYYSDTPQHLMMFGDLSKSTKYILLHEMQHYIQGVEGFGNGGNLNLSEMVVAAGGSQVRRFLTMYYEGNKKFCTEADTLDLKRVAAQIQATQLPAAWGIMKQIFKNEESIKKDCERAFMIYSKYYSQMAEKNPLLRKMTQEVFGDWYMEFFNLVSKGDKEVAAMRQNFVNKGWTAAEVQTLLFNAYQTLSGELESREVQHTAEIDEELLDYFKYYSSETRKSKDVTVVFKEGIIEEVKDYQGALETTDENTYIIHVKKSKDGVNLLHEIGHIVEDEAMKHSYFQIITKAYGEVGKEKFDSLSEFFVECFLGWCVRRNIDDQLTKNLKSKLIFPSLNETDSVFNYMFGYESENVDLISLDKCYEFVVNLLKII
jgi:hypothetical protein